MQAPSSKARRRRFTLAGQLRHRTHLAAVVAQAAVAGTHKAVVPGSAVAGTHRAAGTLPQGQPPQCLQTA
jgi:hypothetical protein